MGNAFKQVREYVCLALRGLPERYVGGLGWRAVQQRRHSTVTHVRVQNVVSLSSVGNFW